jgi:cyclopropane fatty-acyl-phospholipid synthase-like methyltransferase
MNELLKSVRRFGLGNMRRLQTNYQKAWDSMFRGYVATTGMHALLNVGLIDEMGKKGEVDIAAFARGRNLDIHVLRPVCEAFHAMGMFKRNGDKYRLEPEYADVFEVTRGWLEVSWGYAEIFHSLEGLLRKEKVYAKDFYRRSDFVARGSGEMEKWFYFPLANDMILASGRRNVLDLGCGDATFLRRLCAMNRDVNCYGIDLAPAAVEEGKQKVKAAGLENRIHLYAEDISRIRQVSGPLGKVDVATVFFVLHELLYFGEDVLLGFLKDYRRLFPKVPLLAFEAIRPTSQQMRRHKGISIYYFLYHDLSQQRPVDNQRWEELFRAAGFESIQSREFAFARGAVYTLQ